MAHSKITVETTVSAPVSEVWRAYTTPEDIKQWNAASPDWHTTAATVDLREGGAFSSRMEAKDGSMGFDFAGTYTRIVPNELIEYAFGERNAKVEFVVRKIPEQSLKASVKGNAKALLDARAVKTDAELSQLQADAVTAAVQSAFSGAPKVLEEAAK